MSAPGGHDSGLHLLRDGTWMHEGEPVTHERLAALLHRCIARGENGQAVLMQAGKQGTFTYEDTPLRVLAARLQDGAVVLDLSNGVEERMQAQGTLVDLDGSWRCSVMGGLPARFTRAAQLALMDCVEEAGAGYVLKLASGDIPLPAADGR